MGYLGRTQPDAPVSTHRKMAAPTNRKKGFSTRASTHSFPAWNMVLRSRNGPQDEEGLRLGTDGRTGSPLVYVYVRQSAADCALIPLVLFCHNLRVPYTVCPLPITSSLIRSLLQKVGVILLPPSAPTEQDAEMDSLYSPVMTTLARELLHEGQAMSLGVSAESGRGGRWLARVTQLVKEGSVPDVSLVPVGLSYDCVPEANAQQMDKVLQTVSDGEKKGIDHKKERGEEERRGGGEEERRCLGT
ncbi:Glycerol-3-phosphate acyltransferase 2, mitochondrial [Liparis tanakae]|uniref:Glycerol-3-phosphate acyltransferase 2, mitochondrial n=1 Tax=Liparis tanakae TaxID=230148 RepID=A0A4Z2HPI8_9TELE|nr:Glycerol-3-phosphate acyltransferase 2, mitochondrial [Liparis tanakae]